jgi:hypothetical protein
VNRGLLIGNFALLCVYYPVHAPKYSQAHQPALHVKSALSLIIPPRNPPLALDTPALLRFPLLVVAAALFDYARSVFAEIVAIIAQAIFSKISFPFADNLFCFTHRMLPPFVFEIEKAPKYSIKRNISGLCVLFSFSSATPAED